MRRSEREITQRDKLLELLDQCQVMHLGLTDGAAPYVVPLHFGWEEKEGEIMLYFHSAPEGRKLDCVRRNPSCFIAVTGDTRVIGSEEACGWTAAYESLMMEGEIEVLKSDEDKKHGLDTLMRHCGYVGEPRYNAQALAKTAVCRVRVKSVTGKRRE